MRRKMSIMYEMKNDKHQFDPWQVVLRYVFTLYSRLLISIAFVVVKRGGCLWVTGVQNDPRHMKLHRLVYRV